MGTKNSGCCCDACRDRGSCTATVLVESSDVDPYDSSIVRGRCCKCFPRRICVTLTMPSGCNCAGDDPTDQYDQTLGTILDFDCDQFAYSGSFSCIGDGGSFAFTLRMIEDWDNNHKCWLAFESEKLGYTGASTLLIPLGGETQDHDLKLDDCELFEFQFDIELNANFGNCGAATISIAPADNIAVPRCCNETCVYTRACITLEDEYGAETLFACLDELDEYGRLGWVATFDDPYSEGTLSVTIYIENYTEVINEGALPLLRIVATELGTLVSDEQQTAACPAMSASWDYYEGWTVSIKGDTRSWCTDCKCICRCICVTKYIDSGLATPGKVFTGTACWDDTYGCISGRIGGWDVTLEDVEGLDPPTTASFYLSCDECTGVTTLVFEDDPTNPKTIDCPDIVNATTPGSTSVEWQVDGAEPYTMRVACLGCSPCRSRTPITPCCSGRRLPAVLYAEVISTNVDCECLMGATATLVWNGDEHDPVWEGVWTLVAGSPPCNPLAEGEAVSLQCTGGSDCNGWQFEFCGGGPGGSPEPGCSCEPVELSFCGGAGCASCENPATSAFCVLITE